MDQERTYKWVQDRIHDLHAGRLSDADRVRLQDIAKTDPFVRDALDGYHLAPHQDHGLRLRSLSHRIQSKRLAKRRKLLPSKGYWLAQAVAASLVLILVTWAVIYYLGRQDNTVLVSSDMSEEGLPSNQEYHTFDSTVDQTGEIAYEDSSPEIEHSAPGLRQDAQTRANEYLKAKSSDASPSSGQQKPSTPEAVMGQPEPIQQLPAVANAQESKARENKEISAEQDESRSDNAQEHDAGLYANQMPPGVMASRVAGQVLDTYGQPLTGAQISIANTSLTTLSDTYGRFEMYLPERTAAIEFYSTGYFDTTINLSQGQEDVVVMLKPAIQQDHQRYSTTGKETKSMQAGALQSNTFSSYLAYLVTESRFPVETDFKQSSKLVTLHFQVDKDGRPVKIKIIKSNTDPVYEQEALRLIEQGPGWICEGRYPCNKEYTLYFR